MSTFIVRNYDQPKKGELVITFGVVVGIVTHVEDNICHHSKRYEPKPDLRGIEHEELTCFIWRISDQPFGLNNMHQWGPLDKHLYRRAAIYRVAKRRGLLIDWVIDALTRRDGMDLANAKQLASIWFNRKEFIEGT